MKSRALKCLVLASTLAIFNCGDAENALNDIAAAQQQGDLNNPELGQEGQGGLGGIEGQEGQGFGGQEGQGGIGGQEGQGDIGGQGNQEGQFGQDLIGSSSAVVPESSGDVLNQSSAAVIPESSGDIIPASSTSVGPRSSTSVNPRSSSQVTPRSSSSVVAPESSSSSVEVKPESGIFLAEGTEEEKNYMEVEYIRNSADNGKGVLCYPKQLSSTKKHAVVLWGPGGGSDPNDYEGIIRRLASHGFVVVATSESPEGTSRGKPALDWLAKKNTTEGDVLYGKLDMTKVGASGHSMGGLQSEQMAIADDRVITAFLNNSGGFNHNEMTRISASKTVAVVYGEGGMERPNAEGDYNNNGVKAPACLIKMTGGQGNECQNGECGYGHGSGPWDGMAATVAWMRWHLGGEDWRKDDFVGTTGKYIDGPIIGKRGKWKGQCKNF